MASFFVRGDGGQGGNWEMDSREAFKKHHQQVLDNEKDTTDLRDQVGLEFVQVDIQGAVKT